LSGLIFVNVCSKGETKSFALITSAQAIGNIQHLLGHRRFSLLRQDVCDPISVEVDQIYNLACPASPVHYQRDLVQTFRTNVLGAMNVLELARASGAIVLQASTSELYGDPSMHPQPESY